MCSETMLGDKVSLITSVSTKLGHAVANRLGLAGSRIFVTDPDESVLKGTVEHFQNIGVKVAGAIANLDDAEQRKLLFKEVCLGYLPRTFDIACSRGRASGVYYIGTSLHLISANSSRSRDNLDNWTFLCVIQETTSFAETLSMLPGKISTG